MAGGSRPPTVRPLSSLDAARNAWTTLAAGSENVFSTWEWGEIWWRHFGRGRELHLAQVDDGDGAPLALLPLCSERHAGLALTRFIGHGVGDQLGPVCAPANAVVALGALQKQRGGLLLAERLPELVAAQLPQAISLRLEPSPVVAIDPAEGWDGYLATRSSHFRGQIRRRARLLAKPTGVKFRLAEDPERLPADMDTLIALHDLRWQTGSTAFAGARRAFHHEFAATALEHGWLRLWLAEADGKPVAANYGFRFAGAEYSYQVGRDPDWEHLRVGSGLLEHALRAAFEDGIGEYRLLRGDETYKQRYATVAHNVVTVALPRRRSQQLLATSAERLARSPKGRRLMRTAFA
jgi:CelD/BcsL family acetyltransferase involved in cellulose biosynthesis